MLSGQSPIINGTGKQTRDFTFVEDTAGGIMLADQTKNSLGETFNIAQGREEKISDVAEITASKFSEITGSDVKTKLSFQKERGGDVKRHLADISKAKRRLGYRPKIKLEEGIERYINWRLKKQLSKRGGRCVCRRPENRPRPFGASHTYGGGCRCDAYVWS